MVRRRRKDGDVRLVLPHIVDSVNSTLFNLGVKLYVGGEERRGKIVNTNRSFPLKSRTTGGPRTTRTEGHFWRPPRAKAHAGISAYDGRRALDGVFGNNMDNIT